MFNPATSSSASDTHRDWFIAAGLFLAAILPFLPSLHYPILEWDDIEYITRNPWLLNLSWNNVAGVFTHTYFVNYHPLTMLSYMIDFQLFGYEPTGYRVVNFLLHGATVALAYALFRTWGVGRGVAMLAMLFFAIHPLRIESVVWLSERKDVLCGFFFVLTLLLWVLAPRGRILIPLALIAFVLALLSKPMAVSLPIVILLHDFLLVREKMKARIPAYLLLLAGGVGIAVANSFAQTEAMSTTLPLRERLALALYSPTHYLWTTINPTSISPLYPREERPSQSPALLLLAGTICAAALAIVVAAWKRWPMVSFGLLSAAVVLAPVSGIVTFGSAYAADRYSYLPTLFLLVALLVPLEKWLRGKVLAQTGTMAFALALIGVMLWFTLQLTPSWRSSDALWERVLEVYPESKTAQYNLKLRQLRSIHDTEEESPEIIAVREAGGSLPAAAAAEAFALARAGQIEDALEKARAIKDPNWRTHVQMYIFRNEGRLAEAVQVAREVLAIEPPLPQGHHAEAALSLVMAGEEEEAVAALNALTMPTFHGAVAWGLLASNAEERGDTAAAETYAWRAVAINPAELNGVTILGKILVETDRSSKARRLYRRAATHAAASEVARFRSLIGLAELEPRRRVRHLAAAFSIMYEQENNPQTRSGFLNFAGWTAEEAESIEDAERLYTEALTAWPENVEAMQNLAFVHLRLGHGEEALRLLQQAADLDPEDQDLRHNLERVRERLRAAE